MNDPPLPPSRESGQPVPLGELPPSRASSRPLAVWPVFVAYVAAFFVCVVAQLPVIVAIIALEVAAGRSVQEAVDSFQTPWKFVAIALPAQVALLGMWWVLTTYGDPRARRFRGIGHTTLGLAPYFCFLAATPAVLWLGGLLGELSQVAFGDWEEQMFAPLFENMTWSGGIALVLFVASAPAFAEEFFFRGYMQRRLLTRWSPAMAIPTVAVLFAAFHGTPVWAISVLPLGLWFGVLAWRTGSLWPGILCHSFINGSINVWRLGARMEIWPDELSALTFNAGLAGCLACLAISFWILHRYRAPQHTAEP